MLEVSLESVAVLLKCIYYSNYLETLLMAKLGLLLQLMGYLKDLTVLTRFKYYIHFIST